MQTQQHPKTFGRKAVKLSKSQQELLERFLPQVEIPFRPGLIDTADYFECQGPLHLEIGFGLGEYTLEMAVQHPDHRIIGCEVFLNGVASLLKGIKEREIANIRVIKGDAKIALLEMFKPGYFDYIHINHPDPWPKKRHHKRRIIQPETLELFGNALKIGGEVWLSTDIIEYADWMKECFESSSLFEEVSTERRFIEMSTKATVTTRFEQKAIRQGRPTTFLRYRKVMLPAYKAGHPSKVDLQFL
jgi:tRNA (guanine-N7-)-methyltransferase